MRVNRVGQAPVGGHDLGQEAADRVRGEQAGGIGGGGLDEDRAGAAPGAGLVVGDEVETTRLRSSTGPSAIGAISAG
jgi:hypothetical protein